jgi:hypothetical protein
MNVGSFIFLESVCGRNFYRNWEVIEPQMKPEGNSSVMAQKKKQFYMG